MKRKWLVLNAFGFLSLVSVQVFAAEALPVIDCALTDKVVDGNYEEKDTFSTSSPLLHLLCESDKVKKDQDIKAVWIATDTSGVAPDNYKIDEKGFLIDTDLNSNQVWKGDFTLSKPNNNWPIGLYRVDLYINEAFYKSYPFKIK